MKAVTPHLYQIPLGPVNSYIIDAGKDGLLLIDTGYDGSTEKIFKSIEKTGRSYKDITHLLLTHTHPDHAGCAADIRERTGAKIVLHPNDAALAQAGVAGRLPHILTPGLINKIVFRLYIKNVPNTIAPFNADQLVNDGDVLPLAGGIQVIHSPGHSAGHIAFFLPQDDVLIAGDICANAVGLGMSTVYEDPLLGIKSILKVAQTRFDKAVFGHGNPLMKNASKKCRKSLLNSEFVFDANA